MDDDLSAAQCLSIAQVRGGFIRGPDRDAISLEPPRDSRPGGKNLSCDFLRGELFNLVLLPEVTFAAKERDLLDARND